MDVIEKAKELGQSIADSKEMKRLKNSDINLQNDDLALQLMKEYKELQIELVKASKAKLDAEAVEDIKGRLLSKQQELYICETTNEYLEAKSDFDRFMKTINDVISFAITGEDTCDTGNCGSCGGCTRAPGA